MFSNLSAAETQAYVLDCHDRVTQASVKNFQLVHSADGKSFVCIAITIHYLCSDRMKITIILKTMVTNYVASIYGSGQYFVGHFSEDVTALSDTNK